MDMQVFSIGNTTVTEIVSPDIILKNAQDALDLMGEAVADYIILYEWNIDPAFFDLSTRLAGDILQKLTNYGRKLAIIGDFDKYPSRTLRDFIYESNRSRDHIFAASMDEVKHLWFRM